MSTKMYATPSCVLKVQKNAYSRTPLPQYHDFVEKMKLKSECMKFRKWQTVKLRSPTLSTSLSLSHTLLHGVLGSKIFIIKLSTGSDERQIRVRLTVDIDERLIEVFAEYDLAQSCR